MSKGEGHVRGRFSNKEEEFIRTNYMTMTDREIADALRRDVKSIQRKRDNMGLADKRKKHFKQVGKRSRDSYLSSLSDSDRKTVFTKELHGSALYKKVKSVLTPDELKFYEEKFIEFLTDPTIQTVTGPERDILHEMIMAQIRRFRLMEAEKDERIDKGNMSYSKAKEISECDNTIRKCQEALNVTRKQRMKDSSDQAIHFANVIKELQDPNVRRAVGAEAAMLKFMAEAWYNEHMGKNIRTGQEEPYDISRLFHDGAEIGEISSDFMGDKEGND
jgi:hypothetical protein